MKKVFLTLLGCASFLFFSCSGDQDVVSDNAINNASHSSAKSSGNSKLDGLYNKMVNSASYIALKAAQKDFAEKVNFSGDIADVDTEKELMSWISFNISSTNFADYSEAEIQRQAIKESSLLIFNENYGFWNELSLSPNPGQAIFDLFEPVYSTNSDPCGCYDDWQYVSALIFFNWANGVADAEENLSSGQLAGALDELDCTKSLSDSANYGNYNDCLHDCANQ